MNIYEPYIIITDLDDCVHLKQSEPRERFYFITSSVIPILLIMFAWFFLQQFGAIIPMGINYAMIAIILLVSWILFSKRYIIEVKITREEVLIVQKRMGASKSITIPKSRIEKIDVVNKQNEGVFFILVSNEKKSYLLLQFSEKKINEAHMKMIEETLKSMLVII